MLNVRHVLRAFKDSVTATHLRGNWERNGGVVQLAGTQTAFEASCIYLVGAGMALPGKSSAEPGTLFFFCDGMDAETPSGACSVSIDAPLAVVFNALANASAEQERWKARFEGLPRSAGFQEIISLAAHEGSCPAILLNRRGEAIASDLLRKSRIAGKKPADAFANAEKTRRLLQAFPDDETAVLKADPEDRLYCRRITHPDQSRSFLLMEDVDAARDIETLCELTARELEKRLGEESIEAFLGEMGNSPPAGRRSWMRG